MSETSQNIDSNTKERKLHEVDRGLATVTAPILTALAALFLGVMVQIQEWTGCVGSIPLADTSGTNGLLCILAVLALIGAALNVDAYLDDELFDFTTRLYMAGGGYFLFILVICGLNFSTLILYSLGEKGFNTVSQIPSEHLIAFTASSLVLAGKMLTREDYSAWFVLILLAFSVNIDVLHDW